MSRMMGCVLGVVVAIASAPRMESRPPRRASAGPAGPPLGERVPSQAGELNRRRP